MATMPMLGQCWWIMEYRMFHKCKEQSAQVCMKTCIWFSNCRLQFSNELHPGNANLARHSILDDGEDQSQCTNCSNGIHIGDRNGWDAQWRQDKQEVVCLSDVIPHEAIEHRVHGHAHEHERRVLGHVEEVDADVLPVPSPVVHAHRHLIGNGLQCTQDEVE